MEDKDKKKSNGWKSLLSRIYLHEIFMILGNVEILQAFGLCICEYAYLDIPLSPTLSLLLRSILCR